MINSSFLDSNLIKEVSSLNYKWSLSKHRYTRPYMRLISSKFNTVT